MYSWIGLRRARLSVSPLIQASNGAILVKWWNDGDEAKRDKYRAKYKEKELNKRLDNPPLVWYNSIIKTRGGFVFFMKFQIYRTMGGGMKALLERYPVLGNYKLKQAKDGVVITISSLKMLAQLILDIEEEIIIGKSGWDVKDSIEIYDDYRE